ncbi:MAG TPA: pitrilysin family protein [Bacillota bacterium]
MIHRTILDNGLRILTESIPHIRSVAVGLWIGAGSRWEAEEAAGMSHFIEHLVFKGTENRSTRELAEAIDRIGGHMNAYTSKEYTCYSTKILKPNLGEALDLLADMLLRPRFDPDEIEREKGVILEEFKMYEDAPDELVHDLFARCLWREHPLGRPVLGSPERLQALGREQVCRFHRTYYVPENAVLVGVGNITHEEFVDEARRFLGAWPAAQRPPLIAQAPKVMPQRCVRVKDVEQVHLCLGTEGCRFGAADVYVLLVLSTVLGGGSSSRLFQRVREEHGLAYSIYSFQTSFRDTGLFGVYAGTSPETAGRVLDLTLAELERLRREPVDAEELGRAKTQLKTNLVLSLESSYARMTRIGRSELLLGRPIDPDEAIRRLDEVSAEDVLRLAQTQLDPERMALAAVAPVRSPFGDIRLEEISKDVVM